MDGLWQTPLLLQEKLSPSPVSPFLPFSGPAGTAGNCSAVLEHLSFALAGRVKIQVGFGICHSAGARVSDPLPSLPSSGLVYPLVAISIHCVGPGQCRMRDRDLKDG